MSVSIMEEMSRRGITVSISEGGMLRLSSHHGQPDAEFLNSLRIHKAEILAHLRFQEQTQPLMDGMRNRLNAAYTGREIEWETLDPIDARIDDAFKNRDLSGLRAAIGDYEREFHRLGLSCNDESQSEWNARDEVNFQDIIKAFPKEID